MTDTSPAPLLPDHAPTIRPARPDDWRFLDHLQRRHHDAIGFLSRAALENAIARGRVVLALENGEPAGYLYGKAPYQRQEHVAIIFQAAVCYDARRRLLGTALVEAFLARFPQAVRQACLWCASDLDANLFWSALGFAAVASRAGARSTGRTHLFWCRHLPLRIVGCGLRNERPEENAELEREEETLSAHRLQSAIRNPQSAIEFWVPESTRAGVMRERRAVTRLTEADGASSAR